LLVYAKTLGNVKHIIFYRNILRRNAPIARFARFWASVNGTGLKPRLIYACPALVW